MIRRREMDFSLGQTRGNTKGDGRMASRMEKVSISPNQVNNVEEGGRRERG